MRVISNQNGFTYILALTIVMIMGVMLGMVGQSWKTIKQRDREKELLFRGSQIKEAIENWNNPKYTVPGVSPRTRHPLMNLEDLLQDPYSLSKVRFLPHSYAAKLDDTNPKCEPDCAKLKLYQDPMTGKEWTIIRGTVDKGVATISTSTQGMGIIGVASKSDETPFRTDFKDTALEKLGFASVTPTMATSMPGNFNTPLPASDPSPMPDVKKTSKNETKYSQWQFIADSTNDHSKIYRAYHEGW